MDIKINKQETKGAAIASDNEKTIGEMTFSIASDEMIIIDHTEVNSDYRGQGVGEKLLDKLVAWAREQNIKIMPLCPFAKAQFNKNEGLQDVLKK